MLQTGVNSVFVYSSMAFFAIGLTVFLGYSHIFRRTHLLLGSGARMFVSRVSRKLSRRLPLFSVRGSIDSLHLCAVCGVAFLGCTVSSPFIWSRRSVEAVTRICYLIIDSMSTFVEAPAAVNQIIFPVLSRDLYYQAEVITRTCCLIVVKYSNKLVV